MGKWFNENVESSDLLALAILVCVTVMSIYGIGGEDLPKVVIGGLIGYLSKRIITTKNE